MSDNTIGTICAAVMASMLTLLGGIYLQKLQNDAVQDAKFLDGAQATAQETSKLLANGYRALQLLRESAEGQSSADYIGGPEVEYEKFYRDWRQSLIENQFKLIRYFGKESANMLMHLDEIDISPVDNNRSRNPCSAPGDEDSYDMHKIADQVSCYVRFSTITFDRLPDETEVEHFTEALSRKSNIESVIRDLMEIYEINYIKILRKLESRLTELGMEQVTVVAER